MIRQIMNGIEAHLSTPMPTVIDEPHAIKLFNIGYEVLRLKPGKRKRRTGQLKLSTVLRLVRQNDQDQERDHQPTSKPRKRPIRISDGVHSARDDAVEAPKQVDSI
ncbi:Testis-expressed sequence 9 protein [Phytophthora nicotianae]|uniref:Testis-expressed sequence 9 protein n=1 Tax=Phytophthora nicotianae TaxID=4792 RepID=A0A0W8DJS4_PHYNI|nr:Testis-expressed sequence 9 protein [Phytophthora nicotianae]